MLGFLNLVVQCRAVAVDEAPETTGASSASGQRQRQRKGQALAASPQNQKLKIGASAEAKWNLKSDDLFVLEALLAASTRHSPAIEAAQDALQHLAAYEGFLDELPGCLKTGAGSTMARPHVLRKHLLVQHALAPTKMKLNAMSWADRRRAFPDVGAHVARDSVPPTFSRPAGLARQLRVDLSLMSMFMCLINEFLRPMLADYGAAAVEDLLCCQVPARCATASGKNTAATHRRPSWPDGRRRQAASRS